MKTDLKIGAVFPQTEIGPDPAAVAEYARTVESMGYDHLVVYDHILGANADSRPGWSGAYRSSDQFHEVFVLYGYLAAVTERLGLSIGVLVTPLRQTGLVAKQAAAVDLLSGGRLRLGVGVGWNHVEYEAQGENFANRGARVEEQIDLMRRLWTEDLITYEGRWHTVTDAGLNPLPLQRPIPIWMGGGADPVMDRIGRLANGWFYPGDDYFPDEIAQRRKGLIEVAAKAAGRDIADIGIEKIFTHASEPANGWSEAIAAWSDYGATHISLNTMNAGLGSLADHLTALQRFIKTART
jgi:probable F420-dependent oxidoreductase